MAETYPPVTNVGERVYHIDIEVLKKRKASILTVIFGDGDEDCEALNPFGPVIKLEDVVEACGSG
jgi:hypothetical protein